MRKPLPDKKSQGRGYEPKPGYEDWRRASYIDKPEPPGLNPTKKHWTYYYFRNKSPQWWVDRADIDPLIKNQILPNAIVNIVEWKLIGEEEASRLRAMIASPDKENLYVAVAAITEYKQQVHKLFKQNRYKKPETHDKSKE